MNKGSVGRRSRPKKQRYKTIKTKQEYVKNSAPQRFDRMVKPAQRNKYAGL
jgi:hypothetical protein